MKHKITTLLYIIFFLFITNFLFAQDEYKTIYGKIYDKYDSIPLFLTNISLKNYPIGTISNEEGEFIFHIDKKLISDTILISSVGYHQLSLPIDKMIKDSLRIYLVRKDYLLNEVIILPEGITPESIVLNSLKEIKKNYPKKRCYYECFYRGIVFNNKKNKRLIEAAVGIMDFGYDSDFEKTRIKVHELRKSYDYADYINGKKIIEFLIGKRNVLYDLHHWNIVRNHSKMSFSNTNFDLRAMAEIDNQEVYIIDFDKIRSGERETNKPRYGIRGTFYITKSDLAIIKFDAVSYYENVSKKLKEALIEGKYWRTIKIKYNKINNKYILSYIYQKSIMDESINIGTYLEQILIVNNVHIGQRNFDRIKKRHAMKKDINLHEQEFEYHPEFWKHYNILQTNPLHEKAIRDLEKEKKLEEQFEENGER